MFCKTESDDGGVVAPFTDAHSGVRGEDVT